MSLFLYFNKDIAKAYIVIGTYNTVFEPVILL